MKPITRTLIIQLLAIIAAVSLMSLWQCTPISRVPTVDYIPN